MKPTTLLAALFLSLTAVGANAQDTEPPATPPAQEKPSTPPAQRETPPDLKAYQDASKITDPEKKIEALEKFKKDFPNSPQASLANAAVLTTLAQKLPKQETRIRLAAQAMYDGAALKDKGRTSGQIATTLLDAGILLEDAQKYAEINLLSADQTQFFKDQKAMAERRKQDPPSDEELQKRFNASRVPRLTLLGRVEVELGHNDTGKKVLEEAIGISPDNVAAAAALGDLEARLGDNEKALDHLVTARLGGRASAKNVETLNAVYRKLHNGTLDGLDTMLDAEYHKRFPNPLTLDEYKDGPERTNRLVLAEVFTGSGCPPCVGADLAFDAAMERYNRKDLVVVMYHQHIPQPDPMTNPDTQARRKYYDVTGVPSYAVDGAMSSHHGADRAGTKGVWDAIQKPIEEELKAAPEAQIKVQADVAGNTVNVKAAIDGVKSDSKDLKLHVLLLEKEIRYSGENGIRFHPMVVRAMGGAGDDGFALKPGAAASFDQTWNLDNVSAGLKEHLDTYEAGGHRGNPFTFIEKKYQIDRGNLAVVVFVQDMKTKHVLQTAYVDLGQEAPHTSADNSKGDK
ncbi:MAG TPA: hypothetical protein VML19_34995 [Verrucomicrobiae bacterium]|nr:hypothetical protein [Verrucomicrobiae bacterium]